MRPILAVVILLAVTIATVALGAIRTLTDTGADW